MTFSLVQSASTIGFAGATGTATFSASNASGNAIVVLINQNTFSATVTVSSISDTAGNTYVAAGIGQDGGQGNGAQIAYVAAGIAAHAAGNVVSVTFSNTNGGGIRIEEWSGVATSSAVRVSNSANAAGPSVPTVSLTGTVSGDLLRFWGTSNNGQNSAGSGMTLDGTLAQDSGETASHALSAGGTVNVVGVSDTGWNAVGFALVPAGTALTPVIPILDTPKTWPAFRGYAAQPLASAPLVQAAPVAPTVGYGPEPARPLAPRPYPWGGVLAIETPVERALPVFGATDAGPAEMWRAPAAPPVTPQSPERTIPALGTPDAEPEWAWRSPAAPPATPTAPERASPALGTVPGAAAAMWRAPADAAARPSAPDRTSPLSDATPAGVEQGWRSPPDRVVSPIAPERTAPLADALPPAPMLPARQVRDVSLAANSTPVDRTVPPADTVHGARASTFRGPIEQALGEALPIPSSPAPTMGFGLPDYPPRDRLFSARGEVAVVAIPQPNPITVQAGPSPDRQRASRGPVEAAASVTQPPAIVLGTGIVVEARPATSYVARAAAGDTSGAPTLLVVALAPAGVARRTDALGPRADAPASPIVPPSISVTSATPDAIERRPTRVRVGPAGAPLLPTVPYPVLLTAATPYRDVRPAPDAWLPTWPAISALPVPTVGSLAACAVAVGLQAFVPGRGLGATTWILAVVARSIGPIRLVATDAPLVALAATDASLFALAATDMRLLALAPVSMSETPIKPGSSKRFRVAATTLGVLTDASSLTLTLKSLQGSDPPIVDPSPVHDGTGVYHSDQVIPFTATPGPWAVRWQSQGPAPDQNAVIEYTFTVQPLDF